MPKKRPVRAPRQTQTPTKTPTTTRKTTTRKTTKTRTTETKATKKDATKAKPPSVTRSTTRQSEKTQAGASVTKKRAPLTHTRVFDAAVRLADAHGLDGVTMRAIARELRVEAMSLYKHVANKDAILDGLVELVMGEMRPPPLDVEWRAALRDRGHSMREVLLRHPWAAMLIESRTNPAVTRLQHHEASLRVMRKAGFSVELTYLSIMALDSYIYGFVAQEVWWPFSPSERPDVVESLTPAIDANTFPLLIEMAAHVMGRAALTSTDDAALARRQHQKKARIERDPIDDGDANRTQRVAAYATEFSFGLDLLIDGLARARRASGASTMTTPSKSRRQPQKNSRRS